MKGTLYTTEYRNTEPVCREQQLVFRKEENNQETRVINLYPEVTYQKIYGFGGAVTDAVAAALEELGEEQQEEILRTYFGREGLGYRFIRTSIDSCDFSRTQYCAYQEKDGGYLDTEKLDREAGSVLKYLQRICGMEGAGERVEVMLTPWSPPACLKTNQDRTGGGKLKREAYERWAEYICAYIREYRKRGIPVTMLSVQNEPNAVQTWDSCLFTGQEEKTFLKEALYPALLRNGLEDIHVYIWDHNKERIYERTREIIDEETDKMVSGVAFHWYSGDHFEGVQLVREQYPDKLLLFSEGCIEYSRAEKENQQKNAELYAHDMIGNFNAGMNLFIDWNIILDKNGGPNYVGNYCEAPLMCQPDIKSYRKNLSYYYLRHFCRSIQNGAKRIAHTKFCSELDVLSVKNPDGSIAVLIYNRTAEDAEIYLRLQGHITKCPIPGYGMASLMIEN